MSKKVIGLDENGIKLGFYTEAGEAPAACNVSLGKVYLGTAVMEEAEGEEIICECEESDDPEDYDYIKGKTTLLYSTSDLDAAACKQVYGGEIVDGMWKEPLKYEPKLVKVEFTTKRGIKVVIEKGRLITRMNMKVSKKEYGLLEHKIIKLSTGAAGALQIGTPTQAGA